HSVQRRVRLSRSFGQSCCSEQGCEEVISCGDFADEECSICQSWGGRAAALGDDDAAGWSLYSACVGGWHGNRLARLGWIGYLTIHFAADVDSTLKVSSLLNADSLGDNVPGQGAFRAYVQSFGGNHAAMKLAHNHNFTCAEVGHYHAVLSHSDASCAARQGYASFHTAIDEERL